jgi:hypothetical protein
VFFFFLLSGFVVVARSKALLFFFFFFFLHTATFCCIYAPAFIIIQPSDRRISCSLFLHTFNHFRQEKEEREREREGERKNTGKKLRVRAISSKNIVIVVCSQITMDCQEKPESSTKKDKRERKKTKTGGFDFLSA